MTDSIKANPAIKQAEDSSPPDQSAFRDFAPILLVVLVAICLVLPAAMEITGLGKPVAENRTLAAAPGWPVSLADYRTFPQRLTAFVNDHFGLRSQLVRWNAELRLKLGTSSSPSVAVGRDGFLFYAYREERLLEQHTGEEVFTAGDLERWVKSVVGERDWLKQRGIAFYILIAPDKSSIYPELLPDYPHLPDTTTRLDQLVERLKTVEGLEFIDPRAALWRAKQTGRLYWRADSHWGPRGAVIAYNQLMGRVVRTFPNAHAVTLDEYAASIMPIPGDLAFLLNLYDVLVYPEEQLQWKGHSHVISIDQHPPQPYWGWPVKFLHTDLQDRPRLVVFGDSFTDYVLGPQFLYQTFRDPVYTHHRGTGLDHQLIENTNPDLVILELAERYLRLQ
jgi:alginate O-acetyltransferase complex protein AlgJ